MFGSFIVARSDELQSVEAERYPLMFFATHGISSNASQVGLLVGFTYSMAAIVELKSLE